jgi:fermentation-respiration switch protein FrsA (DUF1100 family)
MFSSQDGVLLNGWFIPVKGARRNVLYCHGNAGNISDRLDKIKIFHELGFNIMIFDYRGYGKSSGRPSEAGLYQDAQAAYDLLAARKDAGTLPIVVYGASLGGAVAVDLAMHRPVAGLITEAVFTSIRDMARVYYPWIPDFLISIDYDVMRKVAGLRIPKLFIHSQQDEVIPFTQGQRLFAAAAEPKAFLAVEGGHNDNFFQSETEIRRALQDFMK